MTADEKREPLTDEACAALRKDINHYNVDCQYEIWPWLVADVCEATLALLDEVAWSVVYGGHVIGCSNQISSSDCDCKMPALAEALAKLGAP